VDGTQIRANAGRGKSHKQSWYLRKQKALDKRIEALLRECETIDYQEQDCGSFVKMEKELSNTLKLKERVNSILEDFRENGTRTPKGKDRRVNLTDPESRIMSSAEA